MERFRPRIKYCQCGFKQQLCSNKSKFEINQDFVRSQEVIKRPKFFFESRGFQRLKKLEKAGSRQFWTEMHLIMMHARHYVLFHLYILFKKLKKSSPCIHSKVVFCFSVHFEKEKYSRNSVLRDPNGTESWVRNLEPWVGNLESGNASTETLFYGGVILGARIVLRFLSLSVY